MNAGLNDSRLYASSFITVLIFPSAERLGASVCHDLALTL